ncbi:hypothetical protein C5167_011291 [Papaver somniferum]|uniref:Uncharacterized protein n=1 Tax=Papaver somniferum TaxID=3469 RepID=A0A4Y7K6J9_PAPSO|nr:hypothetical protein C5167_011291 [Papaver somniferum]
MRDDRRWRTASEKVRYCDYKISAFNDFLFSFGRKYSRFLRIWFSMGITFSVAALLGATLVLLWNSTSIVRLYNGNVDISNDLVFGFFSLPPLSVLKVPSLGVSLIDGGFIIFSTLISVAVHEFGHAISAARFVFVVTFLFMSNLQCSYHLGSVQ